MTIASKTQTVLSRFPDFYPAEGAESLFVQLVNVFGQTLEQVETDLIQVMRAHWVDTADNEGSAGFDRVRKGDLDKILAFYLENLGGTSQLKQVHAQFVEQDIVNLTSLAAKLHRAEDPMSRYLQRHWSPETRRLLGKYLFARGPLTMERASDVGELLVPRGTPLVLTRQGEMSASPARRFVTTEAVRFTPQIRVVEVTVQALTAGSVHEVTTLSGYTWQVVAADHALAALRAQHRQPLLVQTKTLRDALLKDLNETILPNPLYHPDRFAGMTLSSEIQALVTQNPRQGPALVRLNYALLEAAYAGDIVKSHAPYRERLKGVISVLERGASTVEGIREIVAINLGIAGRDDAALQAREQIRVTEFLPRPLAMVRAGVAGKGLLLREVFAIDNPNLIESTPDIRLHIHPDAPRPFINPRLVNLTTGKAWQYDGVVKWGDVLVLASDGTVRLNSRDIPPSALSGQVPVLPPGTSRWRFEALAGVAEGRFNQTLFDSSAYEQQSLAEQPRPDPGGEDADLSRSRFDWAEAHFTDATEDPGGAIFADIDMALASIRFAFSHLTPGAFTVRMPWDIPGFTDKFAEFDDHPRHQIRYIVEKVKAAGVFVLIVYEKRFTESHELQEQLQVRGRWSGADTHLTDDSEVRFDLRHTPEALSGGITHEITEALVTSGVFDHTRFDQSLFWEYRPGLFDQTRFDRGLFWSTPGVFDAAQFDRVDFGGTPGAFDRTRFDQTAFDAVPGTFGRTRFDQSVYEEYEPGLLNQTQFERGLFWSTSGVFDTAQFDRVDFGGSPGAFDQTRFDQTVFDPTSGWFGSAVFDQTAFDAQSTGT